MKKSIIVFFLATSILGTSCNSQNDTIRINGNLEETIEVFSNYEEKGVLYPEDKYSLIVQGNVNSDYPGRYELKYYVYSNEGELVKELHRFVNVVDSIAPTYIETKESEFYAGIVYELSTFISDYSDNYNNKSQINVSKNSFVFTSPGNYTVEIDFTDSSNNKTSYEKNIVVGFDPVKLIENVYKNQSNKVTSGTSGNGSAYTRVTINSSTSFTYYHGSTMHYLQNIVTELGKSASIQISAEYGSFHKANLTYHVSGTGSMYSVGFAQIDATQISLTVSSFRSTINDLNLNESSMLRELNSTLPSVLQNMHSYFANVLHLDLK